MMDAIDILIREHRIVSQVLGSLEVFAERVGEDPGSDRATVQRFAEFFHRFVDDCHHGKEEGYLFVKMSAFGFSNQAGPISAMISEQGEGREHLTALTEIGSGSGPLSAREQTLVKGHALGYILRIESHMKREDDILFPVVRHTLPAFVMEELTREFEKFDGSSENRTGHENLLRMAGEFVDRFPPKPAKSA